MAAFVSERNSFSGKSRWRIAKFFLDGEGKATLDGVRADATLEVKREHPHLVSGRIPILFDDSIDRPFARLLWRRARAHRFDREVRSKRSEHRFTEPGADRTADWGIDKDSRADDGRITDASMHFKRKSTGGRCRRHVSSGIECEHGNRVVVLDVDRWLVAPLREPRTPFGLGGASQRRRGHRDSGLPCELFRACADKENMWRTFHHKSGKRNRVRDALNKRDTARPPVSGHDCGIKRDAPVPVRS